MSDFTFTARTSKASPQLFLHCAQGKHIKQALLTVRKAGQAQQEYLKIKLNDVLVSSYAIGGEEDVGPPEDAFSLNFVKIAYDYFAQKSDGSLHAATHARLGPVEERQDLIPAPTPPTAESAARLRELLAAAGFTGAGIARRLHATAEPIFTHPDLEVYRRRLAAEPDSLSTLIALLLVGDPVPARRAGGAAGRGRARRGTGRLAARARARRPARRPPDCLRPARRRGTGPRRGRAPAVRDARPPDRPGAGRARARPLHRERDPGAPALPPRRRGRRDRRQRARARVRRVQPRAQRRRQRRAAGGQPARAGCRRAVRLHRLQSALRRSLRTPSSPSATAAFPATGSARSSRAGCRPCSSPAASRR